MDKMKKYEIVYHIADLCCDNNGWKKELNVVQINNREPVYEIRSWNKDHTQVGDGVLLTPNKIFPVSIALADISSALTSVKVLFLVKVFSSFDLA